MVKITYDLNNKKDVELVENYYWLKYQLKVIEFDIYSNETLCSQLHDFYIFELCPEEEKNKSKIINTLLTFCREKDLINVAEILNDLVYYCDRRNYVYWISLLKSHGINCYLKAYKQMLIEKFGNI